jgi:glycosyltransferase involved in cell wall biosynthesis
MRIAIIGTRGIPAAYGGFETCAEEVSVGLTERGHDVTVYCRKRKGVDLPPLHKGVRLVYTHFVDRKSAGTITHTATSLLHALRSREFDVLLIFNSGNGPLLLLPKMLRVPFAVNVDGVEWKRGKWGAITIGWPNG